jgi:selenide, water dikinase
MINSTEKATDLRLTQTVQKGGCAAKVSATELRKILGQVQFPPMDKQVLVDGGLFDDAAIYQVTPEIALVQTLDFFTPILDSPRMFGRVAAANALSDVYAMGGIPRTAMAILAFPGATMENEVIVEVLQGACDILTQAKVNFVGGHSIDDDTLKFGLSVTGTVHPTKVWSNAKATPGQVLILTKPLGTGTLSAALKRGDIKESDMQEALDSMSQINAVPQILNECLLSAIHSATDITGFGFLGHAMQMAKASQVEFSIDFSSLPVFAKSIECLEKGYLTKAHRSNQQYVESGVKLTGLTDLQKLMLFDPQTSGGLLLSVEDSKSLELLQQLRSVFSSASIIGRVHPRGRDVGDQTLPYVVVQ